MKSWVVGSDEVGYGSWCGDLVVCAVAAPENWTPPKGLTDSKALTHAKREALYEVLTRDTSIFYVVLSSSSEEVDRVGVYRAVIQLHTSATKLMRTRVLQEGPENSPRTIVDGSLPIEGAESHPKADATFPAVSAASVIAKVWRDRWMDEQAKLYPQYSFDKSHGYGTKQHQQALLKYGPCAIHRRSFSPIARLQAPEQEQDITTLIEELCEEGYK